MAAPKGNANAKKDGMEKKFRVRVRDENLMPHFTLFTPEERGIALEGYLLWWESPERDESSFIDWIKAHTDYGQYK